MLKDKVLVNLYILKLDKKYEIYLPVNEKIGNIIALLEKQLFSNAQETSNSILLNLNSGAFYNYNDIVRNLDIKNETNLMLI